MISNINRLNIILKINITLTLIIFLCSCAALNIKPSKTLENSLQGLAPDTLNRIKALEHDLVSLDSSIAQDEAKRVAQTGVVYSLILADEYRVVRQPHVHNILVNIGIKKRGLCFEWAEDLMKQFKALDLKTFTLYEAVAHRGKKFREHNTIVITAKGKDFFEGIVLDPWRNSGDLYWISVKNDKYAWEKR